MPHLFGEAATSLLSKRRGWLTGALQSSVHWPKEDVMLQYDGDEYFLRGHEQPNQPSLAPCIHMHCGREEIPQTLSKLYRFVSILGWYLNGYVDVLDHIWGSHATPYEYGKPQFMLAVCTRKGFNCNFMPIIVDDRTRRALAYWREGLRLKPLHIGYSFLSFYKVLESQFKNKNLFDRWVKGVLASLTGDARTRADELDVAGVNIVKHLYASGRCAVAHGSFHKGDGDPDRPEERVRLRQDLPIMEALAKMYIEAELGVPDRMSVHRSRDRLTPIYTFMQRDEIDALRAGGSVPRRKLALDGLAVSINFWPDPPCGSFTNLELRVLSAHEGCVLLDAIGKDDSLNLRFALDFVEKKVHTQYSHSYFRPIEQGGSEQEALAVLEYSKAILRNGVVELRLPNGTVLDCEMVVPVNVDVEGTCRNIDDQVDALRSLAVRYSGAELDQDAVVDPRQV